MEPDMSDSTKLMASPDDVEESPVAPAAADASEPVAQDEEPKPAAAAEQDEPVVVGAGVEPAAEVRGAFGTQEYTSVGDDPEREATAGQISSEASGATEADAPLPPAEQVAGAPAAGEAVDAVAAEVGEAVVAEVVDASAAAAAPVAATRKATGRKPKA